VLTADVLHSDLINNTKSTDIKCATFAVCIAAVSAVSEMLHSSVIYCTT
jgi:hypothetical protein